jgi:pyruvate dehydrogenase E2 component (dihydrolipoamide acetyltransferase)
MAIKIKVPRLGWSMEEGTFIEWLKREGQPVQAGDLLFAIEGDKAIQEIEAIDSGILRIPSTAPENGETVKVGQTLAYLLAEDEVDTFHAAVDSTPESAVAEASPSRAQAAAEVAEVNTATTAGNRRSNRPRISPRALRVAAELGVDWKAIQGTGRNGRIRERDVRDVDEAPPRTTSSAPSSHRDLEDSAEPRRSKRRESRSAVAVGGAVGNAGRQSFRRTIAARMLEGSRSTAPVTLTSTADATNLASLRAQFKATSQSPGERIPGYTELIMKLVARALQEHPALNSQWIDGQIISPDGIHLAVAVDTPAGLLAPVVRDVPKLGVREIAAQTQDLKVRAHAGQLTSQDLSGGTFTISNLGAFGIDAFTPIINVPQCAILGLGRIERRPMVIADQIVPRHALTLSLTFDHRIVDGAPAARFLAVLRQAIENPGPWLVF